MPKKWEKRQQAEEKYKIMSNIDLHSFQMPTEIWSYVRLVKYGYDLGGDV